MFKSGVLGNKQTGIKLLKEVDSLFKVQLMINVFKILIKILFIFECVLSRIGDFYGFLDCLFSLVNKIVLYLFELTDNIFACEIDLKNILIQVKT